MTERMPGKMWALCRKKQESWLPEVWRSLRYSDIFALAFTSKCSKLQPALVQDVPAHGEVWEHDEFSGPFQPTPMNLNRQV